MMWFILFLLLLVTMFILVPKNKMKYLWRAGIISILLLYLIDSTLIWLKAFSYSYPNVSGLPIFYLLSVFPSAILLCNYCPQKRILRLPYVLIVSALLLFIEFFVHSLGYMHYFHWNLARSYIINILGLSTTLWLSQCIGAFDRDIDKAK